MSDYWRTLSEDSLKYELSQIKGYSPEHALTMLREAKRRGFEGVEAIAEQVGVNLGDTPNLPQANNETLTGSNANDRRTPGHYYVEVVDFKNIPFVSMI